MSFTIDTGDQYVEVRSTLHGMDAETQRIKITTYSRARNLFNKISANIQCHEDEVDLDGYWERESVMLDALHLFDPTFAEELTEIYRGHRACLAHGNRPEPDTPPDSYW